MPHSRNASAEAEPLPDPRHPVWYFPVGLPDGDRDGDIAGYVWADHVRREVGWTWRTESSREAFERGRDWERQVSEARRHGADPFVVVAGLARAPGAGPVRGASSLDTVEDLARTVTEADDQRLLDQLATDDEAWREVADAYHALTEEDRNVPWGGGQRRPNGVTHVAYPVYGEPLNRLRDALYAVRANTDEHRWGGKPLPTLPEDGRLAPADAVRAVTAVYRAERICDGMIVDALKNGLLDAAVTSLLAWHGTTTRSRPTGNASR